MSERLAGVVSLSDLSAASVSASCPLGGIMVNPEQRDCLQRERGKPSYVIFIPDHSCTLSSSKVNVTC